MTDEIHDQLYDEDGDPIFNEDGTPATWFDLWACVADLARERGLQLDIIDNPVTGQRSYGVTGPTVDKVRALRARTGCSLEEAVTTLGIDLHPPQGDSE